MIFYEFTKVVTKRFNHSANPRLLVKFPIRNLFLFTVICFILLMAPTSALAVTTTGSPAGGMYNSTQNVTLTADVPSVIYYTMNGTTPTTGSPRYSTPISSGNISVAGF